MYLHLVPKILHLMGNDVSIVSVSVPEFSLTLTSDDVVAMKPYPNKAYHVAMLKGRKALNGFLVKCPHKLEQFTMVTIWKIEDYGLITHSVNTFIDDDKYDLVSHDLLLAEAYYGAGEENPRRFHPCYYDFAPVHIEPYMESRLETEPNLEGDVWETYSWGEFLREREEGFRALSMSSGRLNHPKHIRGNRYPQVDQAIIVNV